MHPTAVVAIGGNALLRGDATATIEEQFEAARTLAVPIADLVASGWRVIVTHGNGPQVGFIQRRSDLVATLAPELPHLDLDMCVADSQGSVGYIIANTLGSRLRVLGRPERVVAVLTHTVVDADDPAFGDPTKPIGGFYDETEALRLSAEHGWTVAEDSGRGWRRLVPSPQPRAVLEEQAISTLADGGMVVVAGGGGGIPVLETEDGYRGIEAVIDKDLTSAHLASRVGAELLVITTGVEKVAVNFGRPDERALDRVEVTEARRHLADGQFPPGSMGPKVEAALDFLAAGGTEVLVTSPDHLADALLGQTGTRFVHDDDAGAGPAHPEAAVSPSRSRARLVANVYSST